MRIALLHVGTPQGGISLFTRGLASAIRLAGEAGHDNRVVLDECACDFSGHGYLELLQLGAATWRWRRADLVIVQYSRWLWSPSRWLRLAQVLIMSLAPPWKPFVVVVHDVDDEIRSVELPWWRDAEALTMAVLLARARRVTVQTATDVRRLGRVPHRTPVDVIPIYIPQWKPADRSQARAEFGLEPEDRVLACLGYIHERKNPLAIIEALALLPDRYRLWFIGTHVNPHGALAAAMRGQARLLGIEHRIVVTGFVSDPEMRHRLAAADVGVCLYRDASASASVATLLAAEKRLVVQAIPSLRDYLDGLGVPVEYVSDSSAESVVAAICRASSTPDRADYARLKIEYGVQRAAERHMAVWVEAMRRRKCRRGFVRPRQDGAV